jgi:hypothetical protein
MDIQYVPRLFLMGTATSYDSLHTFLHAQHLEQWSSTWGMQRHLTERLEPWISSDPSAHKDSSRIEVLTCHKQAQSSH